MYKPSEFLETLINTSTRHTYKTALLRYLEVLKSQKIDDVKLDELWLEYLSQTSTPSSDIVQFVSQSQTLHLSPKTIRLYGQIVILYLKEAGIEIPNKVLRTLKTQTPINRPISREAELNRNVLQTLLNTADLRLKTEILIAVSSGMRIGELLSFHVQDINLNTTPVEIRLRSEITKNKTARTVFISREATEELTLWLAHRETLIAYGKIKNDDTRCFPYSKSTEIVKLKKLLKTCHLLETDEQTHRTTIHFHLFRKYFLTEFKLAASAEVAEELVGHTGYLSDSYRRLTKQSMQEEYLKAEKYLTISADIVDSKKMQLGKHTDIDTISEESQSIIQEIQQQITELKYEIQVLNSVLSQTLCDTK